MALTKARSQAQPVTTKDPLNQDQVVTQLTEKIQALERMLKQKDDELKEKNFELLDKDRQLQDKDRQLKEKEDRLKTVKSQQDYEKKAAERLRTDLVNETGKWLKPASRPSS